MKETIIALLGLFLLAVSISGMLAYWVTPPHARRYVRNFFVFHIILFLWTSFWLFVYP